jgi:hypothetical protein
MRGAERPPVGERAAFDLAGDGGDHRHFQKFGRRERRQDGGKPRREHRLAGAGRSDHEQVVAAGGCDFERAFGAFLALDVGEVERDASCLEDFRLRPREHLRALEVVGELDERGRRDDLDLGARPRRFRPACGRADRALAARIGADGGGKGAGDRGDRAVEAEFAQYRESRQRVVRDGADRRHQPERDGQVVVASLLGQIGRSEIDGDAPRRQRQPGRDHGRAHALARFGDRLVGQPHDGERRHPRRDLHLHVDWPDLDALERHRGDALDHVRPCPRPHSS